MDRFTQNHAAFLAGYDERAFRTLVEKGIILPSPETRQFKRGKPKTFTREELRLARVFKEIDPLLDPLQKVEVSSWLRTELAPIARQSSETHPYYLALETGWGGAWRTNFRQARGSHVPDGKGNYSENDARNISVLMQDDEGNERPASRLMLVNITAALGALDDDDFVASVLAGRYDENSPAEITE